MLYIHAFCFSRGKADYKFRRVTDENRPSTDNTWMNSTIGDSAVRGGGDGKPSNKPNPDQERKFDVSACGHVSNRGYLCSKCINMV